MTDPSRDRATSPSSRPGEHPGYLLAATVVIGSLVAGFIMMRREHFLLYHTVIEMVGISLIWSVFLLLWTAREHLKQPAFLLLGTGAFGASLLSLLHTLAFKGLDLVGHPGATDLPTQLWMAARFLEGAVFLAVPLWLNRPVRGLVVLAGGLGLTLVLALAILSWGWFPSCHDDAGLSAFKIGGEYAVMAVTILAAWLLYRRRRDLDTDVHRMLQVMFLASVLAELTFTLYVAVDDSALVIGHVLRVLSAFALFLAIVHVTIRRPQALLFRQLQQKQAELETSEHRWRDLAENNPDHIVELDQDLRILYINRPAPGLTRDDFVGQSILTFTTAKDHDRVAAVLARVARTGQRERFETRHRPPDGELIIYETTAVAGPATDHDACLTLVSRNVTERKLGELLRAAHARIGQFALGSDVRAVLQNVLDETEALTDSTIGFFHVVDADQEHLELQAWSSNTLSSMCTAEGAGRHHPVSAAGVWADCIRQRQPVIHNDYASLPDKHGMPDGHAELVRELVVPVIRDNQVVAVLGVGNRETPYNQTDVHLVTELADLAWDVVLRKRAELALAESEHRLVRTMDNLPGMVYRCRNDANWTMEFVSQGCHDLTGYQVEELTDNRLVSYNDLILPADRALVRGTVDQGLGQRDIFQVVYRIRKRDGQEIWVREQGRGVFLDGELQALEGFIYDISIQIKAQNEQQRLEREILEAQKLESLGVLAGGIAHDFNNLLQAILGNAQLALMDLAPDAPQHEYLQQVMTASRRAADLTSQMLAYSGHANFVTEVVDLSRLVREMMDLLRGSIPSSTDLHCHLTSDAAMIEGGPAQIQQVVLNLVTNAAEAIDNQPGAVTVTTDVCHCTADDLAGGVDALYPAGDGPEPGMFVRLTVHDTGPGMDEQTLARLFDPFFTTKFTGRGLGLAAVLGILRSHQGTMRIATEPGSTTFEVLLPRHHDLSATPPNRARPAATSDTLRLEGQRFLVVDDEPAVRAFVGHVLRREGGAVIPAADGLEALEYLDGPHPAPDAVLLDLTMPRLGGQVCYQEIRKRQPRLPVLLMSGYSEDELRRRFPEDGVTACVSKPFEQDDIVTAVTALLTGTSDTG